MGKDKLYEILIPKDRNFEETPKFENNKNIELLYKCGKTCCEGSELFKGAKTVRNEYPEETGINILFTEFKNRYYDSPNFTKQGNTITLIFEKCTCHLVEKGISNPFLCNCTTGYSKCLFEKLFNKPVKVELKKSILRGDDICEQVIHI